MDDDSQGQDRTEVLEAEVRGLTETVAVLQAQLAALLDPVRLAADAPVEGAAPRADAGSTPAPHEQGPAPETRISRRGALALGAAAAVGLGAVADSVLAATPAAAATGNMQYGASNNAVTAGTDLTSTATGETLSIENTAGEGNALSVSVTDALSAGSAIYAVNAGQNNTVKALSNNVDNPNAVVFASNSGPGAGVQGESTSGYGLSGQGGLAPLYLTPATSLGPPTTGTHLVGEFYVDSEGYLFQLLGGAPPQWCPVVLGGSSLDTTYGTELFSSDSRFTFSAHNVGEGAAITAEAIGTASVISALQASSESTGAGINSSTYGSGAAFVGASVSGYGVSAQGGLAPLLLTPAATAGAPTTGAHVLGELYVDSEGVQYRCAAAGTPGTWVPQYSVVPLPSPVRVINTSTGEGGISGPLVPGATVHTSAALAGTNGIPDGAVGVVANLALSGVGGAVLNGFGVLTIFPAGTATPATANINAGAGCYALSNTVTVAFGTGADAGKVSLVWDGGGAVPNAQAYLDVTAYLL